MSPWCLYLCSSAWELARTTCININKADCWGPPVRRCHRGGQRRDASALTSRLISLSVRSTKKWGLVLSQELLLGPCHSGTITELPLLYSHYYFHLPLPLFPNGGNPRGLSMATQRVWAALIFGVTFAEKKFSLLWFFTFPSAILIHLCSTMTEKAKLMLFGTRASDSLE